MEANPQPSFPSSIWEPWEGSHALAMVRGRQSRPAPHATRPNLGQTSGIPAKPPRLLDQVRASLRACHYSARTEKAYVAWIRRFILFHGKRHPESMAEVEIGAYLSSLAEAKVSSSTQNQALAALVPRLSSTWVCWKGHRRGGAHAGSRWTVSSSRAIINSSKPYWFGGRPAVGAIRAVEETTKEAYDAQPWHGISAISQALARPSLRSPRNLRSRRGHRTRRPLPVKSTTGGMTNLFRCRSG